ARRHLQQLEQQSLSHDGQPDLFAATPVSAETEATTHPLIDALQEINPDDLSPREALDLLYKLKKL
ncbi:MAG TPA: hypothetical protein VIQ01_03170, partial [Burkholderiales bacterium]